MGLVLPVLLPQPPGLAALPADDVLHAAAGLTRPGAQAPAGLPTPPAAGLSDTNMLGTGFAELEKRPVDTALWSWVCGAGAGESTVVLRKRSSSSARAEYLSPDDLLLTGACDWLLSAEF